jgi:lipopolysaccharide biosynthesis glycosyltransferase
MKGTDKVVNIALAFDQNFVIPLFTLLTSIFYNNKGTIFDIYAIATGISAHQKQELSDYAQANSATIQYYEINQAYVTSFATSSDPRYGLAAFYRLLLPGMLPENVSKVIYMDIDIIVVGNLSELYDIDIAHVPVAAVPDPVEWDRPDLGIANRADYFNSGVLLMNIPLWKEQKVSERAIDFLKKYPEKATYVDQDALNAVLINNWLKLDDKFNFTYRVVPFESRKSLRALIKNKIIIHYNQSTKPWHRVSSNKLDFLYHEYFKISPKAALNPYHEFVFSEQDLKKLIKIKLDYLYFNTPLFSYLWRKIRR